MNNETATISLERYDQFKHYEKISQGLERLYYFNRIERFELVCPSEINDKLMEELKELSGKYRELKSYAENELSNIINSKDIQIIDLKDEKEKLNIEIEQLKKRKWYQIF